MNDTLLQALRRVHPKLEQRSMRRGALTSIARCGATEQELMLFSGHTQIRTLRRYLGWTNAPVTRQRTTEIGGMHTTRG
jgi:hypothetical protein